MAKMDWVAVEIALGGDIRTTVPRLAHNPVSVPELQVLMSIHGSACFVTKPEKVGVTETDPAHEKARLANIYGPAKIESIYPGYMPNMRMRLGGGPAPVAAEPDDAADDADDAEYAGTDEDEQKAAADAEALFGSGGNAHSEGTQEAPKKRGPGRPKTRTS